MGGGGVMRTAAAKIASFSFRGTPSLVPAENQESKIKSLSSITREGQEPEVLLSDSIQNMPSRVIFGGIMSMSMSQKLQKLKHVLLPPVRTRLLSLPESGPILQAFSLLKKCCFFTCLCENVWDAVMGNERLWILEYHEHKKLSMCFEDIKQTEGLGNMFSKTLDNFKLKVLEMMTSLSTLFQDLFGGQASGSNIHLDANGNVRATIVDRIKGSSFMALAIMVIMVVILKRR
ncbi:hypothetical protein MKW92_051972 [Papaver armeniacum]|nr:hypothetical protein MKW92_051972 [Papaver armeniacum]